MNKERALLRRTGIFATVLMSFIFLAVLSAAGAVVPTDDMGKAHVDVISIDGLKAFGQLERPPVSFLHEKHTEALAAQDKDCSACHLKKADKMVLKYMRLKDTTRQEVMDTYHTNCIACHRETKAANQKSGPITCGECHIAEQVTSSRQPAGMDKSLHYRHSKALDKKCEQCHHEYNESTEKLFYAKGKEGTCRYCHKDQTEENRISMREASHLACIDCHSKRLTKNEDAGPVTCSGCHDAEQQKLIVKAKDIPRMKRNQPDAAFIQVRTPESTSNVKARMDGVAFNHQAHEKSNENCRVCHHADLNACVQCHTLEGAKKGNFVNLEAAMHRRNVEMSCVGCHESKQKEPRCAGCHVSTLVTRRNDPAGCVSCHTTPMQEINSMASKEEKDILAAMTVQARDTDAKMYSIEDIPETVKIDAIVDKYEAVILPHRKIVLKMVKDNKDSKLAAYFHRDKETICQSCHHNSPASLKPPGCASCHGKPFDEKDLYRPGLKAAYHMQCMECHKAMGVQNPISTNCTACHKERG